MEFPWPLQRLASSFQPARAGPGAEHPSDSRTEPVGAGAGAAQPGRCTKEARLRCSPCRLGPRARAPSGRCCGSPVRAALAGPDHWGPVKPRGGVEGTGLRPAGLDHWWPVMPRGGWGGGGLGSDHWGPVKPRGGGGAGPRPTGLLPAHAHPDQLEGSATSGGAQREADPLRGGDAGGKEGPGQAYLGAPLGAQRYAVSSRGGPAPGPAASMAGHRPGNPPWRETNTPKRRFRRRRGTDDNRN